MQLLKDWCYALMPIGTCNDSSDSVVIVNMLQSVDVGLGILKEQQVAVVQLRTN